LFIRAKFLSVAAINTRPANIAFASGRSPRGDLLLCAKDLFIAACWPEVARLRYQPFRKMSLPYCDLAAAAATPFFKPPPSKKSNDATVNPLVSSADERVIADT
jgi:hypothetical protein